MKSRNPNIGFNLDEYNMAAEGRATGSEATASEGAPGDCCRTHGNEDGRRSQGVGQDLSLVHDLNQLGDSKPEETAQPEAPKRREFIDDKPPPLKGNAMKSNSPIDEQKGVEF